jgi:hypothetical protein
MGGVRLALDGSQTRYYRSRAQMVRVLAETSSMPGLKEEYLRIAEQYEQLADQVEKGHLSR